MVFYRSQMLSNENRSVLVEGVNVMNSKRFFIYQSWAVSSSIEVDKEWIARLLRQAHDKVISLWSCNIPASHGAATFQPLHGH